MSFSIENWKKEEDPILDLSDEKGHSVSDKLQDHRKAEASNLREIRRKRDEKRREELELELKANTVSSKLLKYIRPKTDERHPDFLNEKATTAKKEGDELNEKAKGKRWNLRYFEKQKAEEITENLYRERVAAPIGEIYHLAQSENLEGFTKALDSLPIEEMNKVLNSAYKRKYSENDLSDTILKNLAGIQKGIDQAKLTVKPIGKAYKKFIENFLVNQAKVGGELFAKKPLGILPLFESVPYDISHEDQKLLGKTLDEKVPSEDLEKLLQSGDEGFKTLEALLYVNSKKTKEVIINFTRKYLSEYALKPLDYMKENNIFSRLTWRGNLSKWGIEDLIKDETGKYIENTYGLKNGYAIVSKWKGNYSLDISSQLNVMRNLERKLKDSVKLLNEKYGICEFKRYPEEMLLRQVEMHGKDVPYGMVIFPEEDHNDAFDQDIDVLRQLYEGTKEKYLTRIFEVQRKSGVLRFLASLKNQYDNKISYLVIGGHGAKDGIDFGRGYLSRSVLKESKSINKIKDMFVAEPSVVLFSCHTGAEGGFAELLSEKLDANVKAPTIATHPKSLSVKYEQGKPIIDVVYEADVSEHAEYLRGLKPEAK